MSTEGNSFRDDVAATPDGASVGGRLSRPEISVFASQMAALDERHEARRSASAERDRQGAELALAEGFLREKTYVPAPPEEAGEIARDEALRSMVDLEKKVTRGWNELQEMKPRLSTEEIHGWMALRAGDYVTSRDAVLDHLQGVQGEGHLDAQVLEAYESLDQIPVLDDLETVVPIARGDDHKALLGVALRYAPNENRHWDLIEQYGIDDEAPPVGESVYDEEARGGQQTYPDGELLDPAPMGPYADRRAMYEAQLVKECAGDLHRAPQGELNLNRAVSPRERANRTLQMYAELIPDQVEYAQASEHGDVLIDAYVETRAQLLLDMRRVDRMHGLDKETISAYEQLDQQVDTEAIESAALAAGRGTPLEVRGLVAGGPAHMRLMRNVLSSEHDGKDASFPEMAQGPEQLIEEEPAPAAPASKAPLKLRNEPVTMASSGAPRLRGAGSATAGESTSPQLGG